MSGCLSALIAEEVDIILQHSEGGVESALTYAKSISKYMKDVINYVEKRIGLGGCVSMALGSTRCSLLLRHLCLSPSLSLSLCRTEMEFSKGLQRLYQSCKHSLAQVTMSEQVALSDWIRLRPDWSSSLCCSVIC